MIKPVYWSKMKYDVLLRSMYAAYLFNEQTGNIARDLSGSQLNGTIQYATRQDSIKGNVLNFSNDIRSTVLIDRPLITSTNFSIVMEVMRTDNAQLGIIFDQEMGVILNGAVHITFDNNNRFILNISDESLGFVVTRTVTGPALVLNQWQHFCVSYINEQAIHFYSDGIKTTIEHTYEFAPTLNIATSIGGNNRLHMIEGKDAFKGLISHCYIFNTALSDQEVIGLRDFPYTMYE